MACCGREGCTLDFSRGVPAVTCHQVHLANEIQGVASGTIIPPSLQAFLGERGVSLSSWRTGALVTHLRSQTVFSSCPSLIAKQTVPLVPRSLTSVDLKANQLAAGCIYIFLQDVGPL